MSEERKETEIDKSLTKKKKQLEEVESALKRVQLKVKLKELSAQAVELATSVLKGVKRIANAILEAVASIPEGISWWVSNKKAKATWEAEKKTAQAYLIEKEQHLLGQETKMAEEWKKGAEILFDLRKFVQDTIKDLDMDTYKKKLEGEIMERTKSLVEIKELTAEMTSDSYNALEEIAANTRESLDEVVEKMTSLEQIIDVVLDRATMEPGTPSYLESEKPEPLPQVGSAQVQQVKIPDLIFSPSFSLGISEPMFAPVPEDFTRVGKTSLSSNKEFHAKFESLTKGFGGHTSRQISSLVVSENMQEQRKIAIISHMRWFKANRLSTNETGEIVSNFDANLTIRIWKALNNFFEKKVLAPAEIEQK